MKTLRKTNGINKNYQELLYDIIPKSEYTKAAKDHTYVPNCRFISIHYFNIVKLIECAVVSTAQNQSYKDKPADFELWKVSAGSLVRLVGFQFLF